MNYYSVCLCQCVNTILWITYKLLEIYPELAGASEWAIFDKVFINTLTHLVCETNRYAKRYRNMPEFQVSNEEMYNF